VGQIRQEDQGFLSGQSWLAPPVELEAPCIGLELGFDRGTVIRELGQLPQGALRQRGGQQTMPLLALRSLPLQHGGLGASILVQRRGSGSHPALPGAPLLPPRHGPSEGCRSFAAVPFRQYMIAMPESPVEGRIGAKPAVEPEYDASPRRWRQAQYLLCRGDRGAQTGPTGRIAGIDQRHQTCMVLRGADPCELAPPAVFSPLK
jgi:hypothetical protein